MKQSKAVSKLLKAVTGEVVDVTPDSGGGDVYNRALTVEGGKTTKVFDESSLGSGYSGFLPVTVQGDGNIQPGNIKNGVTIYGVTGIFTGTQPSPDDLIINPTSQRQEFSNSEQPWQRVVCEGIANLTPGVIAKGVTVADVTGVYDAGSMTYRTYALSLNPTAVSGSFTAFTSRGPVSWNPREWLYDASVHFNEDVGYKDHLPRNLQSLDIPSSGLPLYAATVDSGNGRVEQVGTLNGDWTMTFDDKALVVGSPVAVGLETGIHPLAMRWLQPTMAPPPLQIGDYTSGPPDNDQVKYPGYQLVGEYYDRTVQIPFDPHPIYYIGITTMYICGNHEPHVYAICIDP